MSNSSICPIDRTLSGATSPEQSGPGSDGKEGVLCIPQSSSITGASPSDCLVLYIQDVRLGRCLTPLQRYSWRILQPLPIQLGPHSDGRRSERETEREREKKRLIDSSMSAPLELFYAKRLGNCTHWSFIFAFLYNFLSYMVSSIPI